MELWLLATSFVAGASLGLLSFVGFPAALFQLGTAAMILPILASFGGAALLSYVLATKYKDTKGITWYGRYGETPAGKLLWAFMMASCIGLAGIGTTFHFPGIGNHYVDVDAPLRTWILERKCVDHPAKEKSELCTYELCEAARRGDKQFSDEYCLQHPGTCLKLLKRTSFDWAMSNCLGTCGCDRHRDVFNPLWNFATGIEFECQRTGSCTYIKNRSSVIWAYIKYPTVIEIHVATGVFIILLVPLQLLKQVRMWKDKCFHRWNGRFIVFMVIPNQISGLLMAILGTIDSDVGAHAYAQIFRIGLGSACLLTVVFVARAVYHVKVNRNIPKHGEFMMRASAIWFAIPFFRMILPFFEAFVGYRWAFPVSAWFVSYVPLACAELYIRKSQRFVSPSHNVEHVAEAQQEDVAEVQQIVVGATSF